MHFLADILIVIASLYTGGLAGGFVRGLFGTALAFSADVAAFTLTNRGLRWAMYGENFTERLGGPTSARDTKSSRRIRPRSGCACALPMARSST